MQTIERPTQTRPTTVAITLSPTLYSGASAESFTIDAQRRGWDAIPSPDGTVTLTGFSGTMDDFRALCAHGTTQGAIFDGSRYVLDTPSGRSITEWKGTTPTTTHEADPRFPALLAGAVNDAVSVDVVLNPARSHEVLSNASERGVNAEVTMTSGWMNEFRTVRCTGRPASVYSLVSQP